MTDIDTHTANPCPRCGAAVSGFPADRCRLCEGCFTAVVLAKLDEAHAALRRHVAGTDDWQPDYLRVDVFRQTVEYGETLGAGHPSSSLAGEPDSDDFRAMLANLPPIGSPA